MRRNIRGFIILCLLVFSIAGSNTLPTDLNLENDLKSDLKYASRLSQLIATKLLRDKMEIDGNNVYSPLGVATTLAILAEASDGETYNEFITALGNPKLKADLRQSFKRILSNFQTQSYNNLSFKTWLYIYRNYTVHDDFKQILANNYYVAVKYIKRRSNDSNSDEPNTSSEASSATNTNTKDLIGFEKSNIDDEQQQEDDIANIEASKEAFRFDKFVDEAPPITEEIARVEFQQQAQQQPANEAEELSITDSDDMINDMLEVDESVKTNRPSKRGEDINAQEKNYAIRKNYAREEEIQPGSPPQEQESNEPLKVTIPLQRLENEGSDIMQALESHFASERLSIATSFFPNLESALTASSITSKKVSSRRKMLVYNGLYYRGNWAYPFRVLRSSPNEMFHLTAGKSIQTPMMHARGKYLIADLEALNSWAVSLPYENQRYSLLVVMPKDIEGLHKLLDQLSPEIFTTFKSLSTEREMYISLPKFKVEEKSRYDSILKDLGLRRLFTLGGAELSQLSDDTDLHVDEIAQMASIRVDEGGFSVHKLPTSSVEQKIEVNRPFLYFLWDNVEDFIIVSGKITAPEFKTDFGVDWDIE